MVKITLTTEGLMGLTYARTHTKSVRRLGLSKDPKCS